jgi:preprotein translocase subunit SecA
VDDVTGIQDANKLSIYVGDIAIEELDKLKNSAVNVEEFYNLERRIVLSSIDELWMRHIDAMSRLREEVAFE